VTPNNMYAIVKTGGKQYRVEPGQRLLVERLPEDVGATVALEPLLYRSDGVVFDEAALGRVKVSAKVLAHERGPKLRVFKFKPKRGYKRRTGHRQELTRIEIGEITSGAGRVRAAASSKDGEEGARKPVSARRPAASHAKSEAASEGSAKPAARSPAPRPEGAEAKRAEAKRTETKRAEAKGDTEGAKAPAKARAPRRAAAKPKKETDDGS
jgi:large subunit ribosomal protein L21